ncbi:hypothetical protein B0G84_3260 [Paraburkholderia sp. BL8N3]|nr:hypothetical protein [Paraburkholderia sp. BL8N3]TCK37960.1 hypothetical protein B0G84_3260 [Paraburkholderia sp. BL8N3]
MMLIQMMLLAVALLLFVLSTINLPVPRVNLTAAGLAVWVVYLIVGRLYP